MADDGSFEDGKVGGLGPGRVVLLVGPSGAGKDAVLQQASLALGRSEAIYLCQAGRDPRARRQRGS